MTLTPEHVEAVLARATCLHTGEDIEKAAERMAGEITAALADENPVILSVMVGGLVPTGLLLKHLSFPLVLDYVHATRYRGATRGGVIEWLVKPRTCLKDRTVLVIDDILDGGVTLNEILKECRANGAKSVLSAVLVEKLDVRHPDGLPKADFTGVTVPDRYVFGYGMDYKNYLRNAAGIYAVDKMDE